MSDTCERDAKRQKIESQGFSTDTDLEVEVEGETFHVHSLNLMLVSPVFKQMLLHSMKEASTRHIDLKDKKKEEFKAFWDLIQPLGMSTFMFTVENAIFLSRWGDEYQVQVLKEQCEGILVKLSPFTVAALAHAVECNLEKRTAQCMERIAKRVDDFLPELKESGLSLPAPVMELLWPCLCKAADIAGETQNMPDIQHIRSLWPFIISAISKEKERKDEVAKLVTLRRQVSAVQRESTTWASQHHYYDTKPLQDEINKAFASIKM